MREAGAEAAAFGGGAFPSGRYVMVGGDPKHVALITETFATADGKTDEWLNKDWFKVEGIKSVSVVSTNATNNFKAGACASAGVARNDRTVVASSSERRMVNPFYCQILLIPRGKADAQGQALAALQRRAGRREFANVANG